MYHQDPTTVRKKKQEQFSLYGMSLYAFMARDVEVQIYTFKLFLLFDRFPWWPLCFSGSKILTESIQLGA